MDKTKKLVLQVGEGLHEHVLTSNEEIEFEQNLETGFSKFIINKEGLLKHEEHGTMKFDKGQYFKYPQVEYDPLNNDIRQVFD